MLTWQLWTQQETALHVTHLSPQFVNPRCCPAITVHWSTAGRTSVVFNRLYAVDANMRQEAVCVYKRRLSPPFHIERFLARTVSSVGMGHEAAGSVGMGHEATGSNPAKSWPRSSSL